MKRYKIEIKWAVIFAAMFLLWMVAEKLAGLHDKHLDKQQFVTMLVLIPSVVVYVLALRDKNKNYYGGTMTYKQSFISGIMLTLFVVLLSPVNQLITSYIITPDYFTNAINYTVETGMFSREQAQSQFNIKNYLLTSAVGGLITGVIFSLIVSFFVKSKNNER